LSESRGKHRPASVPIGITASEAAYAQLSDKSIRARPVRICARCSGSTRERFRSTIQPPQTVGIQGFAPRGYRRVQIAKLQTPEAGVAHWLNGCEPSTSSISHRSLQVLPSSRSSPIRCADGSRRLKQKSAPDPFNQVTIFSLQGGRSTKNGALYVSGGSKQLQLLQRECLIELF
jgi:hypothetical protein